VSLYELLLYIHIVGAVVWLGGGVATQFFALRALASGDSRRIAGFALDIKWVGDRVLASASLLTLVAGIALVWESEAWGFGDDWIVIALVLFAITFAAGVGFFGPESARIAKVVESEGADSPAAQARISRILVLSRLDLVLLFLIVFDMAVKPSFDEDAWTIVIALAVAAVFAALLTVGRGGQRRQPAGATAE
jgi:uncharacterized membrane protein